MRHSKDLSRAELVDLLQRAKNRLVTAHELIDDSQELDDEDLLDHGNFLGEISVVLSDEDKPSTKDYTRKQLISMVANARGILVNYLRCRELREDISDGDIQEMQNFLNSTDKDVSVDDLVHNGFDKSWMKFL